MFGVSGRSSNLMKKLDAGLKSCNNLKQQNLESIREYRAVLEPNCYISNKNYEFTQATTEQSNQYSRTGSSRLIGKKSSLKVIPGHLMPKYTPSISPRGKKSQSSRSSLRSSARKTPGPFDQSSSVKRVKRGSKQKRQQPELKTLETAGVLHRTGGNNTTQMWSERQRIWYEQEKRLLFSCASPE